MSLHITTTQPDTHTPTAPTPGQVIPTAVHQAPAPAPVNTRPVIQLTGSSALALVAGGTGAVLVIGTVLVSMLLAVAITGLSLAVVAVVLRSLLNHHSEG